MSASVLAQLGNLIVEGMPWQRPGEKTALAKANLTANILCARHNSALSPLDDAAAHVFEKISAGMQHSLKNSLSQKSSYALANGEALELWGLKTLLGLFHSKIARADSVPMLGTFTFDQQRTATAFFGSGIPVPLGLYVHPATGGVVRNQFGFALLHSIDPKVISGLRLQVHGVYLDFVFEDRYANPTFFVERTFYRPWVLDFSGPKRTSRIIISWQSERKRATRVNIELGRQSSTA